jgi:hypothetical protein
MACVRPAVVLLLAVLALLGAAAASAADVPGVPVAPDAQAPPAAVDKPIAIEARGATDARIKSRLEQLFATLDGLSGVTVEVTGGVVVLAGVAASNTAHDRALQLARRVEGVVEVQDQVSVSRDLRERLRQVQERMVAQLVNLVGFLPLLVVAILVVSVFWCVARRIAASERIARRLDRNPFLRDLARQAIRVVVVGVGLLKHGVPQQSLRILKMI